MQPRPKTHRTLEKRLNPGDSFTLLDGATVISNPSDRTIKIKVTTPISIGQPHEKPAN